MPLLNPPLEAKVNVMYGNLQDIPYFNIVESKFIHVKS